MFKIALLALAALVTPSAALAGPISEARPLSEGLTNILNFLLSIVGIVAIIGMVIAGSLYFFAAGDMQRIALAKKTVLASVTGIVIALSGYILIRTVGTLLGY